MESDLLQPGPCRWLANSVFAPIEEEYVSYLRSGRYHPNTVRVYFACVAHFAKWATDEGLDLTLIDEVAQRQFLNAHLPFCTCAPPVRKLRRELRVAIRHLLYVLRAAGQIPTLEQRDRISGELAAFDRFMRDVGGLADTTRRQRIHIVRRLLLEQFGDGEIDPEKLEPALVRRFVLGEGRCWGAGAVRVAGGAVGCYLKFRKMLGDDVGRLLREIPRAAHWRLAGLPDVLSPAQIDAVLASFDDPLPSRRRAYAMVRCVTDLGLRCSEVVKLRLDDVDWRNGIIRIARTKTHFTDSLPLPAATGDAIADYLRHERPKTNNRAIFVRHVAPYDVPIRAGVAKHAVIAAFARCGWHRTDPHILRHSIASRLLRDGTPMKHIADILRHRSLDTSKIYTKIDLHRLSAVALPWPGRA
jgi:integrase/recombinase XerD